MERGDEQAWAGLAEDHRLKIDPGRALGPFQPGLFEQGEGFSKEIMLDEPGRVDQVCRRIIWAVGRIGGADGVPGLLRGCSFVAGGDGQATEVFILQLLGAPDTERVRLTVAEGEGLCRIVEVGSLDGRTYPDERIGVLVGVAGGRLDQNVISVVDSVG